MRRWLAFTYGVLAYVVFLGVFTYLAGFIANLLVPKSVDSGSAPGQVGSAGIAAAIDVGLLALFAVQHSVMAREWFKRGWTRLVPSAVERSTYVLLTCVVLALIFWLWRPLPTRIWAIDNPVGRDLVWGVFALGVLVVLLSTFMVNHFDLFGLRQVWLYLRGRPYTPPAFKTSGFYRFVRHPLMVGTLIVLWAIPDMTVGHLLFAAAATGYILLGIRLEERDLARHLGSAYRDYQQRVPMLVPRPGGQAR